MTPNWLRRATVLLFGTYLLAGCTLPVTAQHNTVSDGEISAQLEKLLVDKHGYHSYDSIMPISVDRLVIWLKKRGGERNMALASFFKFSRLESNSTTMYELVLAGNEFDRSRHILSPTVQLEGLSRLYHLYDILQLQQEKLKVALESCRLRKELSEETVCFELGKVYYDLKQYGSAIRYYSQNAEFYRTNGDSLMESSSYNDIGNCFAELGERDSAISAFNHALRILEHFRFPHPNGDYAVHFRNIIRWNLLNIQVPEKFTDKKLALMKEIIPSSMLYTEPHWTTKGYQLLAEYHFQENNLERALALCDSGIVIGKFYSVLHYVPELLELKGKIYLLKQDKANAGFFFGSAAAIRDSLNLINSDLMASSSAAFYESNEKEEQINAMTLASEEEGRRTLTMIYTASATALVALMLAFLAVLLMRSRKRVKLQSNALQTSLMEKEVLLKEIHHRVKNNLQVISSLLDLQTLKMDDGVAKSALEEGKSRVQSIAILHHQLYQHDDLVQVDLKTFSDELFRQVLGVFKKPGQQVEVSLDINHTMIDIDTAVPLGLILNELFTNSFKYAFNDGKPGRIEMRVEPQGESSSGKTKNLLIYRDSGPGLPKDLDIFTAKTLGLKLISTLSIQCRGSTSYRYNDGAEFSITF